MSDDYTKVKRGKLVLKGEISKKHKHKKHKKDKKESKKGKFGFVEKIGIVNSVCCTDASFTYIFQI